MRYTVELFPSLGIALDNVSHEDAVVMVRHDGCGYYLRRFENDVRWLWCGSEGWREEYLCRVPFSWLDHEPDFALDRMAERAAR